MANLLARAATTHVTVRPILSAVTPARTYLVTTWLVIMSTTCPSGILTTNAFDCSGLQAVSVRFRRWLNVEVFPYDRAYVRASNDSVNWSTVWENYFSVEDSTWHNVEYDISQIADGQESVYVRWTMGPTDYGYTFSGWNIDDIEILGLPIDDESAVDNRVPGLTTLGRPAPNPFNPRTIVSFSVDRPRQVTISVFDMTGRRIAVIADQAYNAGSHTVEWNGRDSSGRAVSSGTYLVRMETEDRVVARKVMLIR